MTPAQEQLLTFFSSSHLPAHLQRVSTPCGDLAYQMVDMLESIDVTSADEVTEGLRHLLEAKDCFVRAALVLVTGSRPTLRSKVAAVDEGGEE